MASSTYFGPELVDELIDSMERELGSVLDEIGRQPSTPGVTSALILHFGRRLTAFLIATDEVVVPEIERHAPSPLAVHDTADRLRAVAALTPSRVRADLGIVGTARVALNGHVQALHDGWRAVCTEVPPRHASSVGFELSRVADEVADLTVGHQRESGPLAPW
jgi:hypothetical protein